MRRTSWGTLGATTLGSGLLSWVVLDSLTSAGMTPQPPWLTAAFLVLVAGWLFLRGRAVKRMVAGEDTPMTPLGAARVVTFAKAASITGALLAGFFVAWIVVASKNSAAPLNQDLILSSGVNVLACLLLVVVAMVVEGWCRVPPEDDDAPPNSSMTLA